MGREGHALAEAQQRHVHSRAEISLGGDGIVIPQGPLQRKGVQGILKREALRALPGNIRPFALFLAPVCGRAAILVAYRLYPYGRDEPTLSAELKRHTGNISTLLGCAFAAAACYAVAGLGGLVLLALTLGLMHAIATAALRRLPGLTGDVYGAMCEVSQLTTLLAAPLALAR